MRIVVASLHGRSILLHQNDLRIVTVERFVAGVLGCQRRAAETSVCQTAAPTEESSESVCKRAGPCFSVSYATNIAVTEVRSDNPEPGTSAPQIREDAFVVALQLVDYPVHEWFEEERAAQVTSLRAGDTTIYDMKRNPQFTINNPFHSVHFYFPRAALNLIADNAEAQRIGELHYQPGVGVDDPVVRALVASLMPAFEHPEQASRIFVEHVTMAVGIHAAKTYGGMQPLIRPLRGGLAPWQMKRTELRCRITSVVGSKAENICSQ